MVDCTYRKVVQSGGAELGAGEGKCLVTLAWASCIITSSPILTCMYILMGGASTSPHKIA